MVDMLGMKANVLQSRDPISEFLQLLQDPFAAQVGVVHLSIKRKKKKTTMSSRHTRPYRLLM